MKLLFTGDINFRGLSEPNSKMCSDILAEILPYFERARFSHYQFGNTPC